MAAASEEARRTLWCVEPLSDARTSLAAFFSILPKVNHDLGPSLAFLANRSFNRFLASSACSNILHLSYTLMRL